jgi:hypothetical protein
MATTWGRRLPINYNGPARRSIYHSFFWADVACRHPSRLSAPLRKGVVSWILAKLYDPRLDAQLPIALVNRDGEA